ncbi:MAG: hypothetical protein CMB13_04725 [Euryarchaeota archaeon]|nr:hypothetical protein [Euryarchaeota archaeon]|tara:strand:- start:70 stop:810 length:741 start_codon:yes stop_codon:yes gene_type:complete
MRGGLREVTFFWQIERLHLRSEMIPLLNLCESMTILGVIEQSPESLVLTTRINTKEGKTIDDLQRLGFFSVRELLSEPSSSDEGYVLSIDLNPKFAELIVRRPTCSIRPGSRLDHTGLTYIVRGSKGAVKTQKNIVSGFLRPDRISAGGVLPEDLAPGLITKRQYEVLSTAYALGWYSAPRGCKLEDIAERTNLSRSTVAEHLIHAESAIIGTYIQEIPHWLESENTAVDDESIASDTWATHDSAQ